MTVCCLPYISQLSMNKNKPLFYIDLHVYLLCKRVAKDTKGTFELRSQK